MYVDGHECSNVVEYRKKFLRKNVCYTVGFLNKSNAPTEKAAECLPTDLEELSEDQVNKNVVIFHDESTFQANDDENWMWGVKGQHVIEPKSRGSGIMVSDFTDDPTMDI